MNVTFVISQLFGGLGAISMMLSNWQKKRKSLMFFLMLDSIFYFMQYMILSAYSGAFTNIISFIRVLLFSKKENENKYDNKYILLVVILLYLIIGYFTYSKILDVLPIIATIIYTLAIWQDNIKTIRKCSIIMFSMWLIYDICVKAYVGAIIEAVLLISTIIAIIKNNSIESKKV